MSIFTLKIIACITMILDHIKYAIPETTCFLTQYFGRMSFPLFAFLVGEGYSHTSNLPKYYKRLILFALISQIPFMLFRTLVGQWQMLNILFTLLLGLIAITAFDKCGKRCVISIPIVALCVFLGDLLNVDYGWYGVLTVFVLFVTRKQKWGRIVAFAGLNLIYYYPRLFLAYSLPNLISYLCTSFPAILLLFYNGKLGHKTKYLYYIFYPIHMLILYGISLV